MTTEEKLREKEAARRRHEQRLINAYHRVFSSEDGKIILEDLQERFGFLKRVFNPTKKNNYFGYDPIVAALTDGARSVIIYILERLAAKVQGDANIETAPEKVIKP